MIRLAENWAHEIAADCNAARSEITISSLSLSPPRAPSLAPMSALWRSWADAAARGVKVLIVLAAPCKIHPATAYNSGAAERAHAAGLAVRFVPQPRLLHAKSVLVDGRICWVGSGNMTTAAATHNHELYIRFESPEIAARIAARWADIANPV